MKTDYDAFKLAVEAAARDAHVGAYVVSLVENDGDRCCPRAILSIDGAAPEDVAVVAEGLLHVVAVIQRATGLGLGALRDIYRSSRTTRVR